MKSYKGESAKIKAMGKMRARYLRLVQDNRAARSPLFLMLSPLGIQAKKRSPYPCQLLLMRSLLCVLGRSRRVPKSDRRQRLRDSRPGYENQGEREKACPLATASLDYKRSLSLQLLPKKLSYCSTTVQRIYVCVSPG